MVDKGTRVGAVMNSNDEEVNLFGYGVYVGDHTPVEGVGLFAEMIRKRKDTNPKIELDNGTVIYGCECWWGSEEGVKKDIGDRKINYINVDEWRKDYTKNNS